MANTITFKYAKTNVTLLAHQEVDPITDGFILQSSAQDSSTDIAATVVTYIGWESGGTPSRPHYVFVQVSPKSSGNDTWVTLHIQKINIADGIPSEGFDESEPAGETVMAVGSTTGFEANDYVYMSSSVVAVSEWGYIRVVTPDVSITMVDPTTYLHAPGHEIIGNARHLVTELNLISTMRWRVVLVLQPLTLSNRKVRIKSLATVATGLTKTLS